MKLFFMPGEVLFLEFQLSNGSGWLTSHRLILCEHPHGQLEGHKSEEFWLKSFEEARITNSILTVKFMNKTAKVMLPLQAPALLQEIKNYIEEAANNWKKN